MYVDNHGMMDGSLGFNGILSTQVAIMEWDRIPTLRRAMERGTPSLHSLKWQCRSACWSYCTRRSDCATCPKSPLARRCV